MLTDVEATAAPAADTTAAPAATPATTQVFGEDMPRNVENVEERATEAKPPPPGANDTVSMDVDDWTPTASLGASFSSVFGEPTAAAATAAPAATPVSTQVLQEHMPGDMQEFEESQVQ